MNCLTPSARPIRASATATIVAAEAEAADGRVLERRVACGGSALSRGFQKCHLSSADDDDDDYFVTAGDSMHSRLTELRFGAAGSSSSSSATKRLATLGRLLGGAD